MRKKILIFGGIGTIGFSVAKNLRDDGYDPIIIARNEKELINKSKQIYWNYEICDVLELSQIQEIGKKHNEEVVGLAIENMHPIPKIGQGEDFGNLSSFLLSEKNNWITGQILHIDEGRSTLRIKAWDILHYL